MIAALLHFVVQFVGKIHHPAPPCRSPETRRGDVFCSKQQHVSIFFFLFSLLDSEQPMREQRSNSQRKTVFSRVASENNTERETDASC